MPAQHAGGFQVIMDMAGCHPVGQASGMPHVVVAGLLKYNYFPAMEEQKRNNKGIFVENGGEGYLVVGEKAAAKELVPQEGGEKASGMTVSRPARPILRRTMKG